LTQFSPTGDDITICAVNYSVTGAVKWFSRDEGVEDEGLFELSRLVETPTSEKWIPPTNNSPSTPIGVRRKLSSRIYREEDGR
jgi:hypothetical protein